MPATPTPTAYGPEDLHCRCGEPSLRRNGWCEGCDPEPEDVEVHGLHLATCPVAQGRKEGA